MERGETKTLCLSLLYDIWESMFIYYIFMPSLWPSCLASFLIYCYHTLAPGQFPWLPCPFSRPNSRSDTIENLIKMFNHLYNFWSQSIQTGSKFILLVHSVSCLWHMPWLFIYLIDLWVLLFTHFSSLKTESTI